MPFDIDISGHQFHITERLAFNFRFSWVPLNFTYKYMYPFIPNENVALTNPHYVWPLLEGICCRQGQASIWSCVERTASLFRGIAPPQPPTSTWLARWSLALLASWRLETGLKAHQVHIHLLMLPHFFVLKEQFTHKWSHPHHSKMFFLPLNPNVHTALFHALKMLHFSLCVVWKKG